MTVVLIVGTAKGGFVLRSPDRKRWSVAGPIFKGWKVTTSARDVRGRWMIATASDVYGVALHASDDLATLKQLEEGPAWSKGGERKLNQVWKLLPLGERWLAGVDEAGLFVGEDGGARWKSVEGLNEHETRAGWFPGAGGLCAHALYADPRDEQRLWCGISAVGVFHSDDGGASWVPRNKGVTVAIEDKVHKEIGTCVHALQHDPDDADVIWRQDHRGMYRTKDGGKQWEKIENGLPSGFGFPLGLDRRTKHLFALPLESDEYRIPVGGRLAVFRSTDRGDSWQAKGEGLPAEHGYAGVLRQALCADAAGGVYMGTTSGTLYASADGAETWSTLPVLLPRILTVQAYEV
jgi:ligand-binding sensor domain-containing protein